MVTLDTVKKAADEQRTQKISEEIRGKEVADAAQIDLCLFGKPGESGAYDRHDHPQRDVGGKITCCLVQSP